VRANLERPQVDLGDRRARLHDKGTRTRGIYGKSGIPLPPEDARRIAAAGELRA
jgi:hypothetical protein